MGAHLYCTNCDHEGHDKKDCNEEKILPIGACDECGHHFFQHHHGCSKKSPDDPVFPKDAERVQEMEDKIMAERSEEAINHPAHYGGDTVYEAIKVIEAWGLGFNLGNAVKYISRAGKKDKQKTVEDLKKARWYLDREIKNLDGEAVPS